MNNIFSKLNGIKLNWISYLSNTQIRMKFIFSLLFLIVILIILPNFLQFVESREGVFLEDPILNLFAPVNLTWLTFVLIYGSLIAGIIYFIQHPGQLHTAILTYSILVAFRIFAMYVLPLEPPGSMILLNDPFVQFFGSGEILTKDLFFSGHTATLFMLFLITESSILKKTFITATAAVAVCVLLQHVHYSIDVFAAPFFAYASYKLAHFIITK